METRTAPLRRDGAPQPLVTPTATAVFYRLPGGITVEVYRDSPDLPLAVSDGWRSADSAYTAASRLLTALAPTDPSPEA